MDNPIDLLYSRYLLSGGVSIDTRTIKEKDLFFGISGENFNGSEYAEQALAKGASFAVIDVEKFASADDRILLVENTLSALQELAIAHRERFQGKVLAITGSNGKTTTKELIRAVLSKKYRVHATQGNYNNHLGVPLTILQLHADVEIAIIEMGANHVGEIARLSEIAQPTYGLITNIGKAHTEGFGGIEGVLRGKSELFDYLRKYDGHPFINQQDERLKHMTKRFTSSTGYPEEDVKQLPSEEVLMLAIGNSEIKTQLTGDYNFTNAAAAIAIGRYFGVTNEKIAEALENYTPQNHRSQIIKKGSNTIILDAYNANPDSMRGALNNLKNFEGKKVAILGDMNELSNSEEEHRLLGKEIAEMNLDQVILVGEKIIPALDEVKADHFSTTEDLKGFLTKHSFQDAVILLKASRTIKLEEVIDTL